MLKLFLNYCVVLPLFILSCTSKVEKEEITSNIVHNKFGIQSVTPPKLLVTTDNNSEVINQFLQKNNIQKVGFINDVQFLDPNKPFTFSPLLLDRELTRAFPNTQESGIAYIDLEAPYLEYLMNANINSSEFKRSKKLFLEVLAYAKKARPNVKWGYYYVPFTTYWSRTKAFYDKDQRITEIIQNSDVLFPSIYIFYNKVNFSLENKSYLKENTEQVIRIAQKYNKKVYPLVMTRYHPSNASIGNETIAETDFRAYIATLKNTTYNGKSVDGIMLWNADGYSNHIQEPKLTQELKKSKQNFEQFYDQYLIEFISIMLEKK